jgi:hypothetical protein
MQTIQPSHTNLLSAARTPSRRAKPMAAAIASLALLAAACGSSPASPNAGSPASFTTAAREQRILAFARCLRSHGIPNFPDPTSQGQLTLEMVNAAGVDLHTPTVLTAAKTCLGTTDGAITAADVQRALTGTR